MKFIQRSAVHLCEQAIISTFFFILDQYQLGPLKKTPNDPPVAMDRLQYFKPRRWMIQAASFTLAYWKELFHVVSRLV